MTSVIALAWAVTLFAAPPSSCRDCRQACKIADRIVFAEKAKSLYQDPGIKSLPTVGAMDSGVERAMNEWSNGPNAQSPCWMKGLDSKTFKDVNDATAVLTEGSKSAGSGVAPGMDTNWTTKDCKIDEKNYKDSNCDAIYDAGKTHETVHQKMCLEAWNPKTGGGKEFANKMQYDRDMRALTETRAYDAEIKQLRKELAKATKQKGCGLAKYKGTDLAPKPSPEDVEKSKKNLQDKLEALRATGRIK